MNKITFAIASLTIAASAAALAQDPPNAPTMSSGSKPAHTQFSSLDTNRDGRISRDEIKANAGLSSSFAALDTDHDSYLSESEYDKWKATPMPAPSTMAPAASKAPSGTTPAHPDGVTAPAGDAPKSTGSKDATSGSQY